MNLKKTVLHKLFEVKTPKSYLIIFLHIVKRCNSKGNTPFTHYTDLKSDTNYSKRTILSAIQFLLDNEILEYEHPKRNGLYSFKIHNNDFSQYDKQIIEGTSEAYINLNDDRLFGDFNMKELTGFELKLYLQAKLVSYRTEKNKKNVYGHGMIRTLSYILKVKDIYYIKKCMDSLNKKTKNIKIRNKKYDPITDNKLSWETTTLYFNFKKEIKPVYKFNQEMYYFQRIKTLCRKKKIDTVTKEDLIETARYMNQFKNSVTPEKLINFLEGLISYKLEINCAFLNKKITEAFVFKNIEEEPAPAQ